MYISPLQRSVMLMLAVGIVLAAAYLLVNEQKRYNLNIPRGFAQVEVMGEFGDADLVSPSGERINLRQEGPILVPADEAEQYVVHVKGDKTWMDIIVTSFDGEARWVFALEDAGGTIFRAGNSAITSYHWD